ncbi:hypothetical protein [Conexibacter sp. DBS9H8]|uniref:hypothetical protein n=1 Tax=Conexibacter sp. DBS9H8 TaxID=2937801 RepID=UPI00200F8CD6|nr:hypothetical protein [Conexibacter sp. DBS9H8]
MRAAVSALLAPGGAQRLQVLTRRPRLPRPGRETIDRQELIARVYRGRAVIDVRPAEGSTSVPPEVSAKPPNLVDEATHDGFQYLRAGAL